MRVTAGGVLIGTAGLAALASGGAGVLLIHVLSGGGMYYLSEAMLNDLPREVRKKVENDNTQVAKKLASTSLGVAAFIDPVIGGSVGVALLIGTRMRKLYAIRKALEDSQTITVAKAITGEVPEV